MSLGETAATWWKNVDKKSLAILLLIFILGFAVRAHLMKYDLIFGFDSYFHARITSYVIEDFAVPDVAHQRSTRHRLRYEDLVGADEFR